MLIPYLSRGVVCLFGPRQFIHQARPSARLPATHVGREFETSHHGQQPLRVIPLQSVTIWSLIHSWDFPTHNGQPTPRPLSYYCVFGRYSHHRRDRRAASQWNRQRTGSPLTRVQIYLQRDFTLRDSDGTFDL